MLRYSRASLPIGIIRMIFVLPSPVWRARLVTHRIRTVRDSIILQDYGSSESDATSHFCNLLELPFLSSRRDATPLQETCNNSLISIEPLLCKRRRSPVTVLPLPWRWHTLLAPMKRRPELPNPNNRSQLRSSSLIEIVHPAKLSWHMQHISRCRGHVPHHPWRLPYEDFVELSVVFNPALR